jgi:hypothetical protein
MSEGQRKRKSLAPGGQRGCKQLAQLFPSSCLPKVLQLVCGRNIWAKVKLYQALGGVVRQAQIKPPLGGRLCEQLLKSMPDLAEGRRRAPHRCRV